MKSAPKLERAKIEKQFLPGNLHFLLRWRIARIIRGVLLSLLLLRVYIRCRLYRFALGVI